MLDLSISIRRQPREGEAVSIVPSYEDEPLDPSQFPADAGFAAVRGMAIALAPELAATTAKMRAALILRNLVYTRVPMGPTPAGYNPWLDVELSFRENVRDQLYHHQCGGRCILFLIACRALGIRARYIGLWDSAVGVDPAVAFVHATSEILIGGRWIACDGHYNMTLRDNLGFRLSWAEVRGRVVRGEPVAVSTDGFAQTDVTPDHYLNDVYHETLRDLTSFMAVSVHRDRGAQYPARVLTDGWDGIINYGDGSKFDAVASAGGGVYALLAQA